MPTLSLIHALQARPCVVLAIGLVIGAGDLSASQDTVEVRVAALEFVGNQAFGDGMLRLVMQTRKASRWPWVEVIPFDQRVLDADLTRLRAFYADRGFQEARVRLDQAARSDDGRSIRLRIAIEEGAPTIVDRVTLAGGEGLSDVILSRLQTLPLQAGERRDSATLAAVSDRVLSVLRDRGYPYARVDLEEQDVEGGKVAIVVRVESGPETRFGGLTMTGLRQLKQVVVHRAVTFRPGDLYQESEVSKSQRRLANLQAFEFVNLAPDSAARAAHATVLPMTVTVAEARPHRFEIGVGYGTEDRVRGAFEWRNLNFLGNASQLLANAKFSTVVRGAGFGYEHPYLLPSGGSLSARAGAWWVNESTFESRSAGGRLAVTHEFGRARRAGVSVASGYEVTATYRNEHLTYKVTDAALVDLGSIDEIIALGLNPVTGRGDGTLAGLELDVTRTALNTPADPTRGSSLAAHLAHVAPWLGGTFRFDELVGDARGYLPIRGRLRAAARLRAGTLAAADSSRIPFSERYFLGGSSSVRGWGRYEISPTSDAGVPLGGRTVLEGSVELRFPIAGVVGGVVFLDTGYVWADQWTVKFADLRHAAGGGLRWLSLIGIVRADVGYQLNPIPDLRIGRESKTRRWRLHVSIGHAF